MVMKTHSMVLEQNARSLIVESWVQLPVCAGALSSIAANDTNAPGSVCRTPGGSIRQAQPIAFTDFCQIVDMQFLTHIRRGTSISVMDFQPSTVPQDVAQALQLLSITGARCCSADPDSFISGECQPPSCLLAADVTPWTADTRQDASSDCVALDLWIECSILHLHVLRHR